MEPADRATAAPGGGTAATPVIRTQSLTKRYGEFTAVDRLDLEVRPGEVFGLLGPNGAGKTTTILMLLGLTEPSGGRAEVVGLDPARQPLEVKRRVGYLPDNVGFYGTLTGRENLRFTAELNRIPRAQQDEGIETVLDQVGLAAAADQRVDTYSRGMRQRLGIADALVKDPAVMILDEPAAAIDPEGVTEVLALIRALASDRGVAVLLSSHLLHQVQAICDRVGIFVGGRMVAEGPPSALADRLARGRTELEVGAGTPGEVDRDARVEEALRGVPGVAEVVPDPRDPRLWVVRADRDVRADVARALMEAGRPVWHLRRRGDELDEIYRRYFEAGEADGDGSR